ncbi:MAG: DUF5671 domain-containing protein [Chloroflexota bacterium]|nr:DUF5671 domain-containing protein [Chloroflexota bacterium]
MNEELRQFIKEALERGQERDVIRQVLLEAGWQEREVRNALGAFAEVAFPVAVPRPRPYLHAREAFLYLVSFIALYVFAFSLGAVFFGLIDYHFSSSIYRYEPGPSAAQTTALAAIIVAFPLYLFLMRRLAVAVAADPERRQSLIRRWLTYLTLVVGAAIILGDVIALLARLLAGDPTAGFVLKVLAILLITGPIFAYYLWDMRQAEDQVTESVSRAAPMLRGLVIGAVVVVVATLGYSIYLVGTPGEQRDVRLDRERVGHLRDISRNIDTYYRLNGEMPGSLEDLVGPRFYVESIEDPETGGPYEYLISEGNAYEICAFFATDNREEERERRSFSESLWDHGPGRNCFQLEARAEPR